jgi:hypothetical protein
VAGALMQDDMAKESSQQWLTAIAVLVVACSSG